MSALVIFDFDGTLADTWRDIATALNRTLTEIGLPATDGPHVRAWIGEGVARLIERAVPAAAGDRQRLAALVERFRVHYADCCLDTTRLYPGIDDCLARLARHRLAVLSNKPTRFVERIAAGLGIADRFTVMIGGDTTPVPKPDPRAIAHVVAALDSAPQAIWMVGDSAIDVATGRAAGARTIGCTWGMRPAEELAGADYVVSQPAQIAERIESLTP